MKPSWQSLFIAVCITGIAGWTTPSLLSAEQDAEGIAIPAATTPCKPIIVMVNIADNGKVDQVTVTHLNHTTTIAAQNWQRDLKRHLGRIRRDFGNGKPLAYVLFSGRGVPKASLDEFITPSKILIRRGFNEEDRQTGYLLPVTIVP